LPERKEKNSSNCFVLFFDSSLLLPLGKTNHFKEKKIDAIVGLKENYYSSDLKPENGRLRKKNMKKMRIARLKARDQK
jgi:hypothetical protein